MIRHTVVISFDGAKDSFIADLIAQLRQLPETIPEIASYTVGRDLELQQGPAKVVVIGDFESIDDYRAYSNHPKHVAILDEMIRPNMTGLARAQIEI